MANGMISYALNKAAFAGKDDPLVHARYLKKSVLFRKKQTYERAYSEIFDDHLDFYRQNDMRAAIAFLRVLDKLKGTKLRKNNYTPGLGHELDIVSPMIAMYRHNERFQSYISWIERSCGPIQGFFTVDKVHDCGEDHLLFKSDMTALALAEFKELGWRPTSEEEEIIDKTAERMERSTDRRKYSIERIEAQTGGQYDFARELRNLEPGGPVKALPMLRDALWPHMDCLPEDDGHFFQAFGVWEPGKSKPEIHVTRHGLTPMDAPFECRIFKTCEMKYLSMAMKDRVVDIFKRLDTNQNYSTLPEKGDPPEVMRQYLDNKKDLWDKYRPSKPFFEKTYLGGPFEELVQDIDMTRRLLARMNRLFCLHGEQSMMGMRKGTSLDPELDLSEYIASVQRLYAHVPAIQNPICMNLAQIAEAPELARIGKDTAVYMNIVNALHKGGAKDITQGLAELRGVYFVDYDELHYEALSYHTPESLEKKPEPLMTI